MRLGKVEFHIGYVVDLDNEEMVDAARQAVFDDVCSVYKRGLFSGITIDTKVGEFVTENDIPDFLREDLDYVN